VNKNKGAIYMQMESQVLQVNLDDIIPNRFQPRIAFDDQGLNELAASIKEHGIIQPLVLRKLGKKYEIIAGERRYKAATMAGLTTVPAVISNIDDNKSAEIALVENIQRRDLTPIEEARSYKNLLDKGYLTQEDLAKKMGLSQPAIANKLRLLNLDDSVQQALLDGKISERHARSLLVLPSKEDQKVWLDKIINERMTVRQLDQELKNLTNNQVSDVPLVNINPNINEIKNNATDLNSRGNHQSVASMLVPEDTLTEYSNDLPENSTLKASSIIAPDVNNIQDTPANKFFNPLESEPVNMNPNQAFNSDSIFNQNPMPINSDIEVFDDPTNNSSTQSIPTSTTSPDNLSQTNSVELNPNNQFFQPAVNTNDVFNQPIPNNQEEELVNPMNMVETLDSIPNQVSQTDLTDAIQEVRNLTNQLKSQGFNINIDEADLNNAYQINITINKNN
jgi:ParB family transcriptional regulator, chromosome partitioning protein